MDYYWWFYKFFGEMEGSLRSLQIFLWPFYNLPFFPYYVKKSEILFGRGIPIINNYTEFIALQIPGSLSFENWKILMTLYWFLKTGGLALKQYSHPFMEFKMGRNWLIMLWQLIFGWIYINYDYGFGLAFANLPWLIIAAIVFPYTDELWDPRLLPEYWR